MQRDELKEAVTSEESRLKELETVGSELRLELAAAESHRAFTPAELTLNLVEEEQQLRATYVERLDCLRDFIHKHVPQPPGEPAGAQTPVVYQSKRVRPRKWRDLLASEQRPVPVRLYMTFCEVLEVLINKHLTTPEDQYVTFDRAAVWPEHLKLLADGGLIALHPECSTTDLKMKLTVY